ncbi:MAG: HD domain-containing phosphohydrolase [Candidatus Omnitrophota bacterium]|jgi:HD-GYP domain-containing protein (c-di-GMP phosphodiesterase class II)
MPIDFKKELENAARSMILVHDPDLLIKTIIRAVVEKAKINHASVLLYDPKRQAYVLKISGGSLAKKIPIGFASLDKDDPLIRFFRERNSRSIFKSDILTLKNAQRALQGSDINGRLEGLLKDALYQIKLLDTVACIPSYFRDELLCLFLLGGKKDGKDYLGNELDFFLALASNIAMAIRNAQLFKDLESELNKKHQLFMRTTIALVAAIEAKDNYTHGHTTRVASLSLQIARRLKEKNKKIANERFMENLHIASLLHDVGKIGIPEHILNKKSGLTVGEHNRIKEHPLIGATILKPIKELEESIVGIKYHHERPDGCGYPEGLKGQEIPLIASIISVADAFDAMTTDRPYRPALLRDKAVKEISRLSNLQFNPCVTEAFMELCLEGVF